MQESDFHVMVAVGEAVQLVPLLRLACMLTEAQGGRATLICVTPDGSRPPWLALPTDCGRLQVTIDVRRGDDPGHVIVVAARQRKADLLLLGWSGERGSRRYLLGSTLDPVTRYAPCDIAVVRAAAVDEVKRVLIPAEGGPHAKRAIALARQLAPEAEITALNIAREGLGSVEMAAGYEKLRTVLEPWEDDPHLHAKVVRSPGIIEGILQEARLDYDLMLIGGSDESYVDRMLFGSVPQTVAAEAELPTIIVRRRAGPVRSVLRQAERWLAGLQAEISAEEQVLAYREVRRGARAGSDFYTLIALASAIATLGLMMDSATVIIGAMIVAPLMSAILGTSMGIVQGDARLLWRSLSTTILGACTAIAIGAAISTVIGQVAPAMRVTGEIWARARPTLMDLFVALVSGIVGAYAQCRRSALSAAAGVSIAVALVPPLVTSGIGLTAGSEGSGIFGGALLLFLTNLAAITASASLVFLFFGFRPDPGKRILVFGRGLAGVLVLLLVISGILTGVSINASRQSALKSDIQHALEAAIGSIESLELVDWKIDPGQDGKLDLVVQLRGPTFLDPEQGEAIRAAIAARIDRPFTLDIYTTPTSHWTSAERQITSSN